MNRASRIDRAGHWPRDKARGTVTLDYEDRHRRRLQLTTDQGEPFLLDLARATVLADGDGLPLPDGGWIEVKAAPEMLIEVTAPSAEHLCRLAWHIGNRHVEVEIAGDRLRMRRDHVIEDMLCKLGAELTPIEAPFDPEHGAYDGGQHHGHGHDRHHHDHDDG